MQSVKIHLYLFLLLLGAVAHAQDDTAVSSLTGNWISQNAGGVFTQLEVSADGKFVLRKQHSGDLRRAYMCGKLTDLGDALSLQVGVIKERSASGDIEQSMAATTMTLDVLRRSDKTLVVTFDSRTVVLELS